MAARRSLGRGLDALIREMPASQVPESESSPGESGQAVRRLPLDKIRKSTVQPRHDFDVASIAELADSIREHGILQPLLVRAVEDGFELIAGERRLRAAGEAGLTEAPALVLTVSDREALQLALIENLQRENLNVVEEADGYRVLAEQFHLTQEEIARRVGKARATVANALRILDLAPEILTMLKNGEISSGHAKVLLGLETHAEQAHYGRRAALENLSVRALETLLRRARQTPRRPRVFRSDLPREHLGDLTSTLHRLLGTAVRIEPTKTYANGKKKKGLIEIEFYSNDDLDRILQALGVSVS
jgi:ParB family transcriptional regulator, chromosome partitioning protein